MRLTVSSLGMSATAESDGGLSLDLCDSQGQIVACATARPEYEPAVGEDAQTYPRPA